MRQHDMPVQDPRLLAAAVCDSLVVAADGCARRASPTYWHLSQSWVTPVVEAVRALAAGPVRDLGERVLAAPADPAPYRRLRRALAGMGTRGDGGAGALFAVAWRAAANARLGYHLGTRYAAGPAPGRGPVPPGRRPPRRASGPGPDRTVLVVVPFRDTDGADRLHNLAACLRALGDQSLPRDRYRLTVVEADARDRWRAAIEPYVDTYLHAVTDAPFSKAWAINCGVVNSPGHCELVCALDADILVDRDFLARNLARFQRPGVGAVLPYRDAMYLDAAASDVAVQQRCVAGAGRLDLRTVRAFLLRRPLGGCIWSRAELFRTIGGFDERFQGWGGEDDDFAIRAGLWGALDRYRDPLVHLDHPPAVANLDGGIPTNHPGRPPRWPTWEPGVLDRYVAAAGRP
jgi:hypothetical protein